MRAPLTPIQKRIYDFIVEFSRRYKYPPTVREIRDNFGYNSVNTVASHITVLVNKGYIIRKKHKDGNPARTLQVVDDIINCHIIDTDELSHALSVLKKKGCKIAAGDAVELLGALNIKIE